LEFWHKYKSMGTRKQVEKYLAKVLFVNDNISQKEIAERLKVTEKTVSKWANEGDWEKLKISLLVTKDNQLTALYGQLQTVNDEIKTRPVVRDIPNFMLKPIKLKDSCGDEKLEYPRYDPKDYPILIGNFPNSKDTDMISKLTTAIKRLETETNIGETITVAKNIILFVRSIDPKFANQLTSYCDAFIKQKMSDGTK
jgi:transcriptional regulator with XRE-family HTH domain